MLRNTALNVVGLAVPLLFAILLVPTLISHLGIERFGILTVTWALLGYFGIFDLGLGRATTKGMSEAVAVREPDQARQILSVSVWSMLALGSIAGVVLVSLAPLIAGQLLSVSPVLFGEVTRTLYWLAAALPVVTVSNAYVGALSAAQRFDLINAVRTPVGILNYALPAAITAWSPQLDVAVGTVVITRVASCIIYRGFAKRVFQIKRTGVPMTWTPLRQLLTLGGWLTVSNVIGPIMVYLDRFLLSGLVPAKAIAYYTTPYEVVTRLWLFPSALIAALFPVFAGRSAVNDVSLGTEYSRAMKVLATVMMPVTLLVGGLSRDWLSLWIGEEFARQSALIVTILAIGVYINSFAQISATLLQGVGRAAMVAKIHLTELPLYLVLLWYCVENYGVIGAAIAWTIRISVDAVVMLCIGAKVTMAPAGNGSAAFALPGWSGIVVGVLVVLIGQIGNPLAKFVWATVAVVTSLLWLYVSWWTGSDREWLKAKVSRTLWKRP